MAIKVKYDGIEYDSVSAMCKSLGISQQVLSMKIKSGYSFNDAVAYLLIGLNNREVVYNGVVYSSLKDLCSKEGINYKMARYRVNKGYSVEEVIDFLKEDKGVYYNGIRFENYKCLCEYLGINYSTFIGYKRRGISVANAISNLKNLKPKESITLKGVEYSSIREACSSLGKSYSLVLKRLNRGGWTLEEAFDLVERGKTSYKEVTLEGVTYNSITSACRHYGVIYATVKNRLDRGWTLEEAFGLVSRKKG